MTGEAGGALIYTLCRSGAPGGRSYVGVKLVGCWPTSLVCRPITGGQRDADDVADGIVAGIWSKQSGRPTRADQTCGAELHQLARHKARVAASGLLAAGAKTRESLAGGPAG
jgi:hypothetical protein